MKNIIDEEIVSEGSIQKEYNLTEEQMFKLFLSNGFTTGDLKTMQKDNENN